MTSIFFIHFPQQYAVFEPGTRNTGSDLDHNVANPVAMLNASVSMLRHLVLNRHADLISEAIRLTVEEDKVHTQGKSSIS